MMAPRNTLNQLIKKKKVLICCGPGGVGKTTISASIALTAAAKGYKCLVLTIDPARRLANSLGIQSIDYREKVIPKSQMDRAGISMAGSLSAMMLDTKKTFDSLILKYSSSREKAQAVLDNKLYQHLSNMMAGSQEYMAMEKLYEIMMKGDYDLIVLDTPPSRHALDFLDAPQKMVSMISDSIIKFFLKPSLFVSRAGFKILDKPIRKIFSSFDKVAGFEFLQDLSEMLVATSGLLEGFQERAANVQNLLRDQGTAILLISSPQPIPLREANYFLKKIEESDFPFSGFLFNRVQEMPEVGESNFKDVSSQGKREFAEIKKLFKNISNRDHRELKKFCKKLEGKEDSYIYCALPQLDHDVHDLETLYQLGKMLFSAKSSFSPENLD